jgi:glycosyltransferase involved in cell wall biosynthesis
VSYPKITIITPNYNLGYYLERTILSVISQNYPNLEYIIIDGGSTDNSLEIIKKYESNIAYWVSEKDSGLYNALNKGFKVSTGEIMGWINSDDLLHPKSLITIASYFVKFKKMNWLQGYPTLINENDEIVSKREPVTNKYYFLTKKYTHNHSFVQQESTYWRRSLWDKAGSYISEEYKLAGDFEIWMRFFLLDKLYCTKSLVGGFRRRDGQLSTDLKNYLLEADQIVNSVVESLNPYQRFIIKLKSCLYSLEKKLKLPYHFKQNYLNDNT